jgi:lysine 6-dehydrogenase
MLVLGAGLQGSACALDLLQVPAVERVTLADRHTDRLPEFLNPHLGKKLTVTGLDASDGAAVGKLMAGHDSVMSAVPYYLNGALARSAVQAGAHFADLGGNTEIVLEQKRLDAEAKAKGVTVIPDCGLAPGMVNIIAAEGIRRLDRTESVRIFVGGLPRKPEPPLNYQIVYSLEGAFDYYTTPSWILRDGKPTQVDALSELESVAFPAPIGALEAFHTGGGISTLPLAWQGKIKTMEYKTLRYPGHVAIMKPIRELGLLSLDPVDVKGTRVVPRDAFIAAVTPKLKKPGSPDLVALRVEVSGTKGGKAQTHRWQLVDYMDEKKGVSAMMRTTGYSLAITGIMQVDGRIAEKGAHTPDEAVPFGPYIEELKKRGVEIREV